jgi:hypothetical protein
MNSWRLRLSVGVTAVAIAGLVWWLQLGAEPDGRIPAPPASNEAASPPAPGAVQSEVPSSPKDVVPGKPPSEPPLTAEQIKIADDLTGVVLKEMKVLERARTRLFWRNKADDVAIYVHVLLPAPDVAQIEAFTEVLQKTMVHEDPGLKAKLEDRKRKLYDAFTGFPRKYRFITAAKLPSGEGRLMEFSMDDPRNLIKRPGGTVAINEMTGMLPHTGPGLLSGMERYDFLFQYADVIDDPTKPDLPAFVLEAEPEKKP